MCQHRRMSKSSLALPAEPTATLARCSPLVQEPMAAESALRIAPVLKALGDPVRLRLMSLVASHADGEACVCDLHEAFELSQPTKRGVWVFYRVRTEVLTDIATLIAGPLGQAQVRA